MVSVCNIYFNFLKDFSYNNANNLSLSSKLFSAYSLYIISSFFLLQEYKISFTIDNIFLLMTFLIIGISRVIYSCVVKTMRDTQARGTHYFMMLVD